MKSTNRRFPRQKLPFKSKNKVWRKEHMDWADDNSRLFNSSIRKRMSEKKINIDLYNGKVNKSDMKLTMNPSNLEDFYVPDKIQHYPIVAPRVDVLVGEEAERKFDWKVRIVNPTSISTMESEKMKLVSQKVEELIAGDYTEEEIEKELERFSDYINFEYQDVREKRANVVLKHFVKELRVQHKMTEGFRDVLNVAEEGYLCDIIHNNPVFEKLDPLKTYVIQHGNSNRYQDASVIVIDDYWSPGKFIDTYYDKLSDRDVDYLLGEGKNDSNITGDHPSESIDDRFGWEYARNATDNLELHLDAMGFAHDSFNQKGDYFDSEGNVRVLRVFWSSYKKLLKVTSFDEFGNEIIKYRDESYVPLKDMGETVETRWVRQWWQGVKAGEKVYVDMKPRPIQYNKMGNPGYNHPGVVGRIFNTNGQKAVSLMDRAKVFNYIFDGAFHRLMEAYAKYFGPILEIDQAKMAEGWDITKTLFFAKKAGVLVIDSFKEGNKGSATGKLAGVIGNTSGRMYNPEIADYIQQNISFMEYAKAMMDEIIGVPKQRLGNVEKRETVGGVDTAIRQGNYVTAMLYKQHDEVKREALMMLLETSKIALKGNQLKLQYISDDYMNQIMDIDGDRFAEEDYGLEITNDNDNVKLEQKLDMLAQAALQNQTLSFSTVTKIYTSPSLVEIQRLIEKDEKQIQARQAESQQEQNKVAMEEMEKRYALEERKLAIDEYDIDERSRVQELKILMDQANNFKDEDDSLDWQKLALERQKHMDELKLKMQQRDDDMKKHKDEIRVKEKQITESKRKAITT